MFYLFFHIEYTFCIIEAETNLLTLIYLCEFNYRSMIHGNYCGYDVNLKLPLRIYRRTMQSQSSAL